MVLGVSTNEELTPLAISYWGEDQNVSRFFIGFQFGSIKGMCFLSSVEDSCKIVTLHKTTSRSWFLFSSASVSDLYEIHISFQKIQPFTYSIDRFTCCFLAWSCWQLNYCKVYSFIVSEREWKPMFKIQESVWFLGK